MVTAGCSCAWRWRVHPFHYQRDVNTSGGGWPAGFTSFNLRSVLRVMLLSASTHHRTARRLSRRSLFRIEAVLSRLGCSASTEFHRKKIGRRPETGAPMTSLPLISRYCSEYLPLPWAPLPPLIHHLEEVGVQLFCRELLPLLRWFGPVWSYDVFDPLLFLSSSSSCTKRVSSSFSDTIN